MLCYRSIILSNISNVEISDSQEGYFIIWCSTGDAFINLIEFQILSDKSGYHRHVFFLIVVHVEGFTVAIGVKDGYLKHSAFRDRLLLLGCLATNQ